MERKKESYRHGDQFRVVALPSDITSFVKPQGSDDYLKNGDIITLHDPPIDEDCRVFLKVAGSKEEFALLYMTAHGTAALIPVEWVEEIVTAPTVTAVCHCDIMVTGCICGVFDEEMKKKGGKV